MANAFLTRGFSALCVSLALCLGAGAGQTSAQQDQQQDQGPPQYPQQAPQDQSQPPAQDQGPPQYPQQNQQPDQGPPQYPQQAPQDQGQPPAPDQGASQYPQQAPPDQGPPQYPQQAPQDQGAAPQPGSPQQGSANIGPQGPAQSPGNVARISFVQGDVKISSDGRSGFQPAVSNMPLIANSSLQTGQDGQAEVEFADGSVARLTPNSSFALGQLSQDSVELQQNSGLLYYELNTGQGHPAFHVEFPGAEVAPTANAIFRMGLDNVPEVAVMTGSVEVSGNGFAATTVSENQSMRLQGSNGAPFTIAQSITPDSWDQWNQDRDQAISQEASQQTSVRDEVGDAGDENWNDLDSYGNWYPVQGANVWVPAGVSAGWDPFGYGYWGYYPGFGYTYISGYPWGWLPYHCGVWNYYSFGWGWAPGGCGRTWFPVVGVRGYRGYFLPPRPVARVGFGFGFVSVNRGPAARGPWGAGHPLPFINHAATLNVGGRMIAPVGRTAFNAQGGLGARGTSPGVRAALRSPGQSFRYGGAPAGQASRPTAGFNGQAYQQYRTAPQSQYRAPTQPRADSRSTYVPRSTPTPHYSAPPAPRAAPAQRGGNSGRR